jgi:hypothetical protein
MTLFGGVYGARRIFLPTLYHFPSFVRIVHPLPILHRSGAGDNEDDIRNEYGIKRTNDFIGSRTRCHNGVLPSRVSLTGN